MQNVSHTALFVIVNIGNIKKSLNKLCCIHIMEHYEAIKVIEDGIYEPHLSNEKKQSTKGLELVIQFNMANNATN